MRRLGALGLLAALLTAFSFGAPAARAAPPAPKAYVVVDVDTGNVIASQDARTLHLPASTVKLMTALIAAERLPPDDLVPISALAASMPARKINVKTGQTWKLNDLMHCLLMISANDAAVAIAERVGGTVDGFKAIAQATAARLGLADNSMFNDPAGLDDEFAHDGGSLTSGRDLAIVARAVLARPDLMGIIGTQDYRFDGGDGVSHHFTNHNLFLGMYQGATGMKTGTTDKAGSTFVGSASRGGRTMLVVELDAPDPYATAAQLLDQGFATRVELESKADALPAVVRDASVPTTAPVPTAMAAGRNAPGGSQSDRVDSNSAPVAVAVLLAGLLALAFVRRAMLLRRQQGT
ncbi:MAG: D-alanyl-D-alanine carboxypeptidase family protein [Acidimicrobiales bacterium]